MNVWTHTQKLGCASLTFKVAMLCSVLPGTALCSVLSTRTLHAELKRSWNLLHTLRSSPRHRTALLRRLWELHSFALHRSEPVQSTELEPERSGPAGLAQNTELEPAARKSAALAPRRSALGPAARKSAALGPAGPPAQGPV